MNVTHITLNSSTYRGNHKRFKCNKRLAQWQQNNIARKLQVSPIVIEFDEENATVDKVSPQAQQRRIQN